MQSLTVDDVPIALKDDNVEVRITEVGGMTLGFFRLSAGVDLSPALVGLEGDRCPCPHWGYMLEGRLGMHTAEGDSFYERGRRSTGHPATARSR